MKNDKAPDTLFAADTPALDHALARLGPLRGTRIALARTLDPAKAVLAARLRRQGAQVVEGFSPGAAQDSPQPGAYVLGAGAEDLTGQLGATLQGPVAAPLVPIVDVWQSALLALAYERVGIGQASVMALLDITNLQLAGRSVLVSGYDPIGAGVADHAAALGARVNIVEVDPLAAYRATLAGHSVSGFAQALPLADVVFVTPRGPRLSGEMAAHLRPGALLCAAGDGAEIAPEILAAAEKMQTVRDQVQAFDLPQTRGLKLIAGGKPVHQVPGQGVPQEALDICLGLHILGLRCLIRSAPCGPGVITLDSQEEADLAAIALQASGGRLEPCGVQDG